METKIQFIKPADFFKQELNILIYILYKIQKVNKIYKSNNLETFKIELVELKQHIDDLKKYSKNTSYDILKNLQSKIYQSRHNELNKLFKNFNVYYNETIYAEIQIYPSKTALIQDMVGDFTDENFENFLKLKNVKLKTLFLLFNSFKSDGRCDIFKNDILGFYDFIGFKIDLNTILKIEIPKLQEFYKNLHYIKHQKPYRNSSTRFVITGVEFIWHNTEISKGEKLILKNNYL